MELNADYHIHYYMDVCAWRDMTMSNIDEAAYEKGLNEIAILCHSSVIRPEGNGPEWKEWDFWHTPHPERFNIYLYDFERHRSNHGIKTYSGVETELLNTNGDIATPQWMLDKIDFAAVSLHYLPDMMGNPVTARAFPSGNIKDPEYAEAYKKWQEETGSMDSARAIETLVNGYIAAIKKNPKVRSLAHLDWFGLVSPYGIYSDAVKPDELTQILEPLMKIAVEYEVIWELTGGCKYHPLFERARELGVGFSPTSDAHSINGTWGWLSRRDPAAEFIEKYNLKTGRLVLK